MKNGWTGSDWRAVAMIASVVLLVPTAPIASATAGGTEPSTGPIAKGLADALAAPLRLPDTEDMTIREGDPRPARDGDAPADRGRRPPTFDRGIALPEPNDAELEDVPEVPPRSSNVNKLAAVQPCVLSVFCISHLSQFKRGYIP